MTKKQKKPSAAKQKRIDLFLNFSGLLSTAQVQKLFLFGDDLIAKLTSNRHQTFRHPPPKPVRLDFEGEDVFGFYSSSIVRWTDKYSPDCFTDIDLAGLVKSVDVAKMLGVSIVSVAMIYKKNLHKPWYFDPDFPPPEKMVRRNICFDRKKIDKWIAGGGKEQLTDRIKNRGKYIVEQKKAEVTPYAGTSRIYRDGKLVDTRHGT